MSYVCAYLASLMIVGVAEVQPGWMQIDHLDPVTQEVFTSHIYTDDYLSCEKTNEEGT